jgi:hypothetical protein
LPNGQKPIGGNAEPGDVLNPLTTPRHMTKCGQRPPIGAMLGPTAILGFQMCWKNTASVKHGLPGSTGQGEKGIALRSLTSVSRHMVGRKRSEQTRTASRDYSGASSGAGKRLGLAREQVIRRSLDEFVEPSLKPQVSELWQDFLERGELAGTLRMAGPDGSRAELLHREAKRIAGRNGNWRQARGCGRGHSGLVSRTTPSFCWTSMEMWRPGIQRPSAFTVTRVLGSWAGVLRCAVVSGAGARLGMPGTRLNAKLRKLGIFRENL